jgi:hypothetical protein
MREDQVDSSAFWGFLVAKEGLGEEGKAGSVRNRMQTVLSTMKEGMRRKCAVRVSLESVQPSRCFDGLFTFFPLATFVVRQHHQVQSFFGSCMVYQRYRQHILSTVLWWSRSLTCAVVSIGIG